jgi:hypothetical protein
MLLQLNWVEHGTNYPTLLDGPVVVEGSEDGSKPGLDLGFGTGHGISIWKPLPSLV